MSHCCARPGALVAQTKASIAQFSERDAAAFPEYEAFLHQVRKLVTPILDAPLPHPNVGSWQEKRRTWCQIKDMVMLGMSNAKVLVPFYELLTGTKGRPACRRRSLVPVCACGSPLSCASAAPASHILDRYFESEMLKTTLAKDAIVGAMCSPKEPGSA